MKFSISTDAAPKPVGTYSQAIQVKQTVYLSGQVALASTGTQLVSDDFIEQAIQVFKNLGEVCSAAGGTLDHIVKLTIYLTDLNNFSHVNDVMSRFFKDPYPARTTIEVSALPKDAKVEVDAIMELSTVVDV